MEIPENPGGKLDDLARRSVRNAQGFDLRPGNPEHPEEIAPRREPAVGHDMLLGIPGEGNCGVFLHAPKQELYLQGREVLDLVDHEMAQGQGLLSALPERTDTKLPESEKKDIVLGVEFRPRRGVPGHLGEDALKVNQVPVHEPRDVLWAENPRSHPGGYLLKEFRLAQNRGPVVDDLLHPAHGRIRGDVFLERHAQEGVQFDALDEGGGVVAQGCGQVPKMSASLFANPVGKINHLNPAKPERGEHMADEVSKRPGEDDHHGFGAIDEGVRKRQVGDSMEGHGGLP